jgi:hypothetical protein
MKIASGYRNQLWKTILVLFIITPLGFATKFYSGWGQHWVYNYAGDILYPVFWYFLILLGFPRCNPIVLAIVNFTVDVLIECSQIYSNAFLEMVRSSFIGLVVLGQGFDIRDVGYYLIGNTLAVGSYYLLRFQRYG